MNDTSRPYPNGGYSANVTLRLRVNGSVFALAQVGRDEVVFDEPTILPEGDAEIIVTIDGEEMRRSVEIDDRTIARRVIPVSRRPI